MIIPSPPGSPALPEGDETVSPTDLSDDTIILPVEESQVSPTDISDDTIILPVKEPQVPQYIIQQQKLIKCELIVKITKLSDSDINAHLKITQPPTARKRKGITPVKKQPVTVLANPQSARRYIFKLQRFGLKRKISKNYRFRCVGKKCRAIFKSVKEWNDHHLFQHSKITYQCQLCGKTCYTPISYRDHKYFHGDRTFQCGQCRKNFHNASQLNLHKHFHQRDRLYCCFASKCNHNYKWPQDLLRHIKVHLSTVHKCTKCDYSTKSK